MSTAPYAPHPAPPELPSGSVGFIARRPDRPERLALYWPDGRLSNSYAQDLDILDISLSLQAAGYRVVPIAGRTETAAICPAA